MILKILLTLTFFTTCIGEEKFVIGGCGGEGLFSAFLCVIGDIMWAEKNGKIPVVHWTSDSLYYQREGYNGSHNVWEYYFEPLSSLCYEPGDEIWKTLVAPDGFHLFSSFLKEPDRFNKTLKFQAHEIVKKYIKIKPSIQAQIDAYYEQNMAGRKTVGIHLRGTDRLVRTDKEGLTLGLIKAAKQHKIRGPVQYFIATDDESMLTLAKQHLRDPVIHCNSHRSLDGSPLHKSKPGFEDTAIMGEEALIETILLSRCDYFVYTHSSLPVAVLAFNPQLKNFYLAPQPWLSFNHPK